METSLEHRQAGYWLQKMHWNVKARFNGWIDALLHLQLSRSIPAFEKISLWCTCLWMYCKIRCRLNHKLCYTSIERAALESVNVLAVKF